MIKSYDYRPGYKVTLSLADRPLSELTPEEREAAKEQKRREKAEKKAKREQKIKERKLAEERKAAKGKNKVI